jgi:hypothetical protein
VLHFRPIPIKITQKITNTLFAIKFRRNIEFFVLNFVQKIGDKNLAA